MSRKTSTIIVIIVVVVVVAAAAALLGAFGSIGGGSAASGENAASSTVASFGQIMQQVSIMAPNASSTIAAAYAPYVAPALLAQWEADPASAPGRVVSSPWPDHIVVTSVTPQGAGYVVDGTLVFMTSNNLENGGNAGTTPVVAQLVNENGTWQIVAFQGQNTGSTQ